MQISEIMTRDVETIAPDASLQQAAAAMEALGVGSLPVCDGRRLVGAITDRDIVVRGVAAGLSPIDGLVSDCMTEDIAYAFCDEEADEVLERMKTLQVRRLAVLDRDKTAGRHRLAGRHRDRAARRRSRHRRCRGSGNLRAVTAPEVAVLAGVRHSSALMDHDAPLEWRAQRRSYAGTQ